MFIQFKLLSNFSWYFFPWTVSYLLLRWFISRYLEISRYPSVIEFWFNSALQKTMERIKRQTTDWEEMLADHISDWGIVSSTYKGFSKLKNNKTKNPLKKMGKWCIQTLHQRRYVDGKEAYEEILNISH